jgi:hypothetical protein
VAEKALVEQQGIQTLAASYNAKMSMVGNTLWLPGNYVYIVPASMGMDVSTAMQLGLGGYYYVAGVSGKVDSTGWTVDIECMPQHGSQGDKEAGGRVASNPAPTSKTSTSNPETAGGGGASW